MLQVYYCPVCQKFTREDDYGMTPIKQKKCETCGSFKNYIMSFDDWKNKKASMSDEEWKEYRDSVAQRFNDQLIEAQNEQKRKEEAHNDMLRRKANMAVTTADLKQDYSVIGPVYIQVNNRSNLFRDLSRKYDELLKEKANQMSNDKISGIEIMDILFLNAGGNNGHADFDKAFFIAVEELKERAALLGADAIVGMRQDIDIDSTGFQYFYLQMYGTAVKFNE